MSTLHQPDEVIATYKLSPSSEESTSAARDAPGSPTSPRPRPSTSSSSIDPEPAGSYTSTITADEKTQENIITISRVPNDTRKVENNTHVAHVALGTWNARFLCMYDEPGGTLHNAKVIDMNESMRKATGWRREDDEKPITRKEQVEEQRADVRFGIFKKPRSKTAGLCTLRETDDAGWRFLQLRTRGGVDGGEGSGEHGDRWMVSSIARRVIGGIQITSSSVAESGKWGDDGVGSEDEEEVKIGGEDGGATAREKKR